MPRNVQRESTSGASPGNQWGPRPDVDGPAGRWFGPGRAVGQDTLGTAVSELHAQHPNPVQGEDLPVSRDPKFVQPVTSRTYRSGRWG